MNGPGQHPRGFYPKRPDITFDLAQFRWLQSWAPARSLVIKAECQSCGGWEKSTWVPWLKRITERRERVASAILDLQRQHWDRCPRSKHPQIRISPDPRRLGLEL